MCIRDRADAILLAKNIDGVYSEDPRLDASAVKYEAISYDEVLAQHLAVMDTTATSLSMDNDIPVIVFALKDPEDVYKRQALGNAHHVRDLLLRVLGAADEAEAHEDDLLLPCLLYTSRCV